MEDKNENFETQRVKKKTIPNFKGQKYTLI